jgi:hypothetical protein
VSKHTPGPWTVLKHSWCETSIAAAGFDHVCTLDINHATEESQGDDEAKMYANANLIAAAPDLLHELRMLNVDQNGDQKRNTPAWRAICKATGSAA